MKTDVGLDMDIGREPFEGWAVDNRLHDSGFVCSSEGCESHRPVAELRLELLREAASFDGSACWVPSNDVESAGGVGGL